MDKLGIEPQMLLAQIVNFAIMVVVLTKFLYRPILKMLDERKKKIEEGLKLAQEMKIKQEELDKERDKVLDKAKAEGQKIIEEHKNRAKKLEAEISQQANEEIRLLKEKAKAEIEAEKENVWSELNKQVLNIALSITKTVLSDYLDKKTQGLIIEKKLAQLTKDRLHAE